MAIYLLPLRRSSVRFLRGNHSAPVPVDIHDSSSRTEQSHFHGIDVEVENFRQFLHRKSFHLFQDQQLLVLLRERVQHSIQKFPSFGPRIRVHWRALGGNNAV